MPQARHCVIGGISVFVALIGGPVSAQTCVLPKESNEAKLLAFYEAPIAFSFVTAPTPLPSGSIRFEVEVVPVPTPDPAIEQTGQCFQNKSERTHIAPVFGRPRIAVGLPGGFMVEGSYLPPITIADAEPNLASAALSYIRHLPFTVGGGSTTALFRIHGTVGSVQGAITCPHQELQTDDPVAPCYGTSPSHDTFHPYSFGGEGALGLTTRNGRWSFYAGGGISWLKPRFQVDFTNNNGAVDNTHLQVDLVRGTVFGGITARLTSALELSAQLYSVPADVTTIRFGAGYRLR